MKQQWILFGTYCSISLMLILSGGLFIAGCGEVTSSNTAYVANLNDDTVSVIRTSDNIVIDTITVGDGPYGVAVTPNGARVYVANVNDDTVSVIRTSDNTVIATITVGDGPRAVAVTP